VVVTGTPEDVAAHAGSYTGGFLKLALGLGQEARRKRTGSRR